MMFAKDYTDCADRACHPDHNQFVVRRTRDCACPPLADSAIEDMIINQNENYNPGFVARKKTLDNNGRFSCMIPLLHIFGFCRDIRKVIFGASHNAVLAQRQCDDYALWHSDASAIHGAVKLSELAL